MADRLENKGKKARKRTKKNSSPDQEKGIAHDGSCPDVQSSVRDICTCFGVSGLFNAKKRKIESQKGLLVPLKDEWNFKDVIQDLSPGIQQRYAKEMSTKSFKLLEIMKRTMVLFKQLHGGRKYLKDITMDIYLKDIKTKPTHSLPNRYVEIGLWKQVMQVNQQVCQRMEQLERTDENSTEATEEKYEQPEEERELEKTIGKDGVNSKSFRDYYMEMVTSSFGDDLDRLRQEGTLDSRKVEMLINCLEAGKDIWSDLEKTLLQPSGT